MRKNFGDPDGSGDDSAGKGGGWGAATIVLLINTLFSGVGTLYDTTTGSVEITLVTTIGVLLLAALIVLVHRGANVNRKGPRRSRWSKCGRGPQRLTRPDEHN